MIALILIGFGIFLLGLSVGLWCGISYVLARKEFRDIHDAI